LWQHTEPWKQVDAWLTADTFDSCMQRAILDFLSQLYAEEVHVTEQNF